MEFSIPKIQDDPRYQAVQARLDGLRAQAAEIEGQVAPARAEAERLKRTLGIERPGDSPDFERVEAAERRVAELERNLELVAGSIQAARAEDHGVARVHAAEVKELVKDMREALVIDPLRQARELVRQSIDNATALQAEARTAVASGFEGEIRVSSPDVPLAQVREILNDAIPDPEKAQEAAERRRRTLDRLERQRRELAEKKAKENGVRPPGPAKPPEGRDPDPAVVDWQPGGAGTSRPPVDGKDLARRQTRDKRNRIASSPDGRATVSDAARAVR